MLRFQNQAGTAPAVRVVVASGGTLTRMALANLLAEDADVRVASTCKDERETSDALQRELPDVLIIDPELLGKLNGVLDALPARPRILLFSATAHCGARTQALQQACGFLSERASLAQMRALINEVDHCPRTHRSEGCPMHCRALKSLQPPRLPLTPREYTVFLHIGDGQSNLTIAGALGVSVKTIEAHRESIKRKLGLSNAVRLAEAAMLWRRGEFETPAPAEAPASVALRQVL